MTPATVGTCLEEARARGVERLDAQLLMGHLLGRPRTWILAHDEHPLADEELERWGALCTRRAQGVPLAHIVGGKEFHGLWLEVDAHVLVPRPETELLVERALAALAEGPAPARVLDLGTGSGAIALAVKAGRPDAIVHASDVDAGALSVARQNAARLALDVTFRLGAWWAAWEECEFDIVVANPPYVAAGDPHLEALAHEPALALVAGPDGLDALREIVAGAAGHVCPGGELWLEHSHDQAGAVRAMLARGSFDGIRTHCDLAGVERVTGGRRV